MSVAQQENNPVISSSKTTFRYFVVILFINTSIIFELLSKIIFSHPRGESRTDATSKMELFVIIVNGWKPLTIITKISTFDVAAVLGPPLEIHAGNAELFINVTYLLKQESKYTDLQFTSDPHTIHFSGVVAKKPKSFE